MIDQKELEKQLEEYRKAHKRGMIIIILEAIGLFTLMTLYKFVW